MEQFGDDTFHFSFALTAAEGGYLAEIAIADDSGATLWDHKWKMKTEDLNDLLAAENGIEIAEWADRFLRGNLNYGCSIEVKKLLPSSVDAAQLQASATRLNMDQEGLRNLIVNGGRMFTFSYRASWREDVCEIVYIPQFKQFVRYGQGEY